MIETKHQLKEVVMFQRSLIVVLALATLAGAIVSYRFAVERHDLRNKAVVMAYDMMQMSLDRSSLETQNAVLQADFSRAKAGLAACRGDLRELEKALDECDKATVKISRPAQQDSFDAVSVPAIPVRKGCLRLL